jgi:predicted dehydrogenase
MTTSMNLGLSWSIPPIVQLESGVAEDVIRVGVIGYGYWGPNIVRNFHGQEHSRVVMVCDKSANSVRRVRQAYPDMLVTGDAD